jgi:hypothetical protein
MSSSCLSHINLPSSLPITFKNLVLFHPLLIAYMRSLSHIRVEVLGVIEEPGA